MLDIILIVLPIFIVLFIGAGLKPLGYMDENFVKSANRLIFNVCLPILLFRKISLSDLASLSVYKPIIIMVISTTIIAVSAYVFSRLTKSDKSTSGTISMNSFRANYAYMGLPVSGYAFGDHGLLVASVLMAFVVPYVNLMSVTVLGYAAGGTSKKQFITNTIFNPLAVACVLGLIFSIFNISYPVFLGKSLDIVSGVTLPLALFCVGASLRLKELAKSKLQALSALFFKLFALPALAYLILKITGSEIGLTEKILVIMLSAPSATVNYVLASKMGGNSIVAANNIAVTTVTSIASFTFWLYFLGV